MLTRRSALGALTAAAVASGFRPARAAPAKTIRIGYQKNGVFLVAKTRGELDRRFADQGVAVEWREFQFGPPLVEALNVGAIDIGSVGDTPPIFAQAAKARFLYAASYPGSGAAILIPKDSTLKTVAELKGRRVSIPKGSSAHSVAVAALEQAGLSFKDITPVYLAPADGQVAFAQGAVDAWSIWDPYFAIAEQNAGAKPLLLASELGPQYSFLLAARDFAEQHPETLGAAVDAFAEIGAWANANKDAVAQLFATATNTPLEAQKRAVARTNYAVSPVTQAIIAAQQRTADRFFNLGLIPTKIAVAEAVWRPEG